MMKNLLIILTFSLLVYSCNQGNNLDGLWYPAYKQHENGKPEPLNEKFLLDIKDDSCYTITIGNLATGDLDEIIIEGHTYDRGNNTVYFDKRNFDAILKGDSLTLKPMGKIDSLEIRNTIVFRKLNSKYKNTQCLKNNFKGSVVMSGKNFTDSLDFISDSILIHTGEWNLNFPANKWEIVNYQDFSFFYIHDYVFPLTLLKFCSKDSIVLGYPFKKGYDLVLRPTEVVNNSDKLIGEWNEIHDSTLRPPPPPSISKVDRYYRITIEADSIRIRFRGSDKKFNWQTSADGKRIYFMDRIFEKDGSWKILELKEDRLKIRLGTGTGIEDDNIIKLEKKSNNR